MDSQKKQIIDIIARLGDRIDEIDRYGTADEQRIFSLWRRGELAVFGEGFNFLAAKASIEILQTAPIRSDLRELLQEEIVNYFGDADTVDYVRSVFRIGWGLNFIHKDVQVRPINGFPSV